MITDFIFDGYALSDFGYIMFFEDALDTSVVSNMEFSDIKGARSDIAQQVSYSYGENYNCSFLIIKNLCYYDGEEQFMTNDDISEMVRWLACKKYKWFRFVDSDDTDEIWYKAQIQIEKEFAGDRVIGLHLSIVTNAPYGFTKEYTVNRNMRNATEEFQILVPSDEHGRIYPDVSIKMLSAGMFTLQNRDTGKTTIIRDCDANEIITIQGGNLCQISSTKNHNWESDFNYIFPYFEIDGTDDVRYLYNGSNCDITFQFRGIRKVGMG